MGAFTLPLDLIFNSAIIQYMAIDWTKICRKYKGLWVGFKKDEKTVVASGETVAEVIKKAKQKGYPEPILFRVPTEIVPYVGSFGL